MIKSLSFLWILFLLSGRCLGLKKRSNILSQVVDFSGLSIVTDCPSGVAYE